MRRILIIGLSAVLLAASGCAARSAASEPTRPAAATQHHHPQKQPNQHEHEPQRAKVLTVESSIAADWDSERIEQSHMREKLNDIAAEVSRLVYAVEGEMPPTDETLLERVQKYSDDAALVTRPEPRTPEPVGQGISVSDRLKALRDMQDRI